MDKENMKAVLVSQMLDRQLCPLCQKTGLINYLQSYQINLEEAVVLCENKLCPYPLAQSSFVAATFTRRYEEILPGKTKEERSKIPDPQMALQTKVASHMRKFGHKLQKDAIGIQTGSPQLKKKLKPYSCQSREPYKKRGTTPGFQRQTGLNSLPQLHLSQNCSPSFQNFKSFSPTCHIPGATNGAATWNNCNGSEGSSDKDSLLNSSLDSLESNSSSSSHSSIGDGNNSALTSKYPAFQFGQCKPRSSPTSMPNLRKSSSQSASQTFQVDKLPVENEKDVLDKVSLGVEKNARILNTKPDSDRVSLSTNLDAIDHSCHFTPQEMNNVPSNTGTLECKEPALKPWETHSRVVDGMKTCSSHEEGDDLLRYPSVFPQWRNKDALCWLDVILCLAVHNETLKSLVFSESFDSNNLIYKLFKAHNQACRLLQKSQIKCTEHSSPNTETVHPLNGFVDDKNQAQLNGTKNENAVPTEISDGDSSSDEKVSVEEILDGVREEIWEKLQCRLKCEKGQNESPVFALPLLLKANKAVEEFFRMNYWFEYKCSECGKYEKTDHSNTLPSFPAITGDFRICDPHHRKTCPKCGNTKDVRTMVYKKLPECLLMHFVEGLPDVSWAELQFGFHGYLYTVTGVMQYVNNPDHFISWLRNPKDNKWIKCDDLRPVECRYRTSEPKFPSSQIHIVMWERVQSKPRICRQVAMEMDENKLSENPVQEKKLFYDCDQFSLTSDKNSAKVKLKVTCNNDALSNKKKSTSSVKCTNLNLTRPVESSCSTLSTESSDSVLLPNFISSTPASKSVLQPIPKPVCSLPGLCVNGYSHHGNSLQVTNAALSCLNQSEKSVMNSFNCDKKVENPDLLQTLKAKVENRLFEDSQNEMVGKNCLSNTCTKMCGQKALIKPSTVFCVPKKSSELMGRAVSDVKLDEDNKAVKGNICESAGNIIHAELELKDRKLKQNEDSKSSVVAETNSKKMVKEVGQSSGKECKTEVKELADIQTENTDTKQIKKQTSSSRLSQGSRFKVPLLGTKRHSVSVSRDAFFTLETNNSRASSSACTTPASISSTSTPAMNGNLTYLSSVKQYLLSRTTSRTEQKFKFEGLNLKSASNSSSSLSLSELDLPMTGNLSSNDSDLPVANDSACDSLDAESMSNYSDKTSSVIGTDALVRQLIERLEEGPQKGTQNPMTLKRKLESASARNSKKRSSHVINESDEMSSGNASLKENSDVNRKKKVPGGKNMKLVRKLVKNSEKAKTEKEETKLDSSPKEIQNKVADGNETKCETETVLQDLYEALNIPFNSVNATMSDIMTDVDDILNFVNVGDVLPGQHHGDRTLTCFDDSFLGNQKHSDCWIRKPGRNSA